MSYSWLAPVASTIFQGIGDYQSNRQTGDTQSNILDILRASEQSNYENALAEHQARLAQSAGARSAAASTDASRRGALAKSQQILNKGTKKAMKQLRPYAQAGKQMLPFHTNTAKGGLQGMDMLSAFMQSQPKINPITSLSETNVGSLSGMGMNSLLKPFG